ncbi:MAG: hypothetical protein HY681_05940 [Chloroflexi bacterium]|nr:hypothetical protein [Chloroflexota bacterium]
MTTLRQLYDLQEADLEIDRLNALLVSLNKRLQDDSAVVSTRQTLAQRREALQQMRRLQARRTQDVGDLQAKAKDLETRLYGGGIRTIKEMEALQAEVKGQQEQARRIEDDELLALMVKLEEEEAWVERASEELAKMERERLALVEQLTAERSKLEAAFPGLKARRLEIANAFAPGILAQYERLRSAKQGRAMAKVEREMCNGCRITLPARDIQRARMAKDQPALCPSCGRMLFVG